jgi:putative polyhydroxyalkanoate system protein
MADIHLERKHALGLAKAKAAAQRVADELASDYGVTCSWDGDVLRFERRGVQGELAVTRDLVRLDARLGMLLAAMRPRIEAQIQDNFARFFG